MDILEFLHKAKNINSKVLGQIIEDEANNLEPKIVELQKEQLSDGENSQGNIVGTYTPFTEAIASIQNPLKPKKAGQPYNFQWSGRLFKSLFSKSRLLASNNLTIETDGKAKITDELKERYSNLLGLNSKKQEAITRLLEKNTIERLNNLIK